MSSETVLVSEVIFATRERLYEAWLDSEEHSAFTAEAAVIEPVVGGSHSTFAGYATGQVLALEPHRRIIQSWRTTEFPAGAPDSRLEVTFEDTLGGTLVTVLHTGIPSGQSDQYRDAWLRYYFAPMKDYFARESAPDTVPDFLEPSALSPAPPRAIGKSNGVNAGAKVKVGAQPKAKAKAKAKAAPARKKAVVAKRPKAVAKKKPKAAAKKKPKAVAKKKPKAAPKKKPKAAPKKKPKRRR